MEIENNILDLGKFTYSWVRQKQQWRLFALVFGAMLLTAALAIGGILLAVASIVLPMLNISASQDPNVALFAGFGLLGVLAGILAFAAAILISTYYCVRPLLSALRAKGFKTIKWTWMAALRYIWLGIVKAVYIMLSLNEKKWLPLALAFYASILVGIFFLPFLLVTALLALPYTILVVYNSVRLSCAYPHYLVSGTSPSACIGASSKLTRGKAWPVFAFYAAILFFWGLVTGIVSYVSQMFIQVLAVLGVAASAAVNSPAALIAGIVLAVALMSFSKMLIATFSIFTSYYLQAGVYEKLANEKPAKAAAKASAKKRAARKQEKK